jgi:ATP-binding cassette subfamily A (ABC1) protein 3
MLCSPPIILLDEPSTGMDPEARRFMWSVIHKMSTKGRKSSVIMTTHSMDEAETLCKRMGIMVNGEFVCLGKANQIKDKYGYGYEADVRIKPMSEKQQEELFIMHNFDKRMLVNEQNIEEILERLDKKYYSDELKDGRLGERIKREMTLNDNVPITTLLNWIFFVENALKFIETGKNYFEEIILSEHIENNFLFKMKKEKSDKSIGFFFGLYEQSKEKCFVTEYSFQQTSLEQIFNKFASNQGKNNKQNEQKINEIQEDKKNIVIDDILISKLT